MTLHTRIGLIYLPGALPCFEDFGNLPTDLVCADAKVDGKSASEVLDMLIIPGGSLVESQSVNPAVTREIIKMAESGKYVLGICSGFQVLAKETDVGRLSTIPVKREGLGLLDAEFKPLICTDRVTADIVDKSFLTREVGKQVTGFHCHTYGEIKLHGDSKPILITHAKHVNYFGKGKDLISGVANKSGNVVGIFIHGLLDNNPTITQSIMSSLDMNQTDLAAIKAANAKLLENIKGEVGISTGIRQQPPIKEKVPKLLLVTALGSGSGKTFVVTGIAGALKKRGYKVGVIKVGGDIRDAVPSLYLIKEPVKEYSSIAVGQSGWMPPEQAIKEASKDYNFLLVEGAMNAFTGLLNDKYKRPMSTVEVAATLGASTVLVVACDQEGLEGALLDTLSNIVVLQSLGVNTTGVILNKLHVSYLTKETVAMMQQAFAKVGVQLLGMVPRLNLEHRGMIPEIEIRYEDFCAQAIKAIEKSLNIDLITKVAAPPKPAKIDYDALTAKFKNLITHYSLNPSQGGNQEKC
ncbi:MAG: AAA family ATPase [Candidatus Bathyarchaeota archaeon]|nr:AAA family ATPase [Candidatus Bathyarchaeota archaeon]